MNPAHLHLVTNHLPIIIPIVGFLVMLAGAVLRIEAVKRTAYAILVLGALSVVPAYMTGDEAEETVEEIQGIDSAYIHEHEDLASVFSSLSYALGALSLLGFWASWKQKSFSPALMYATMILCLAVLFFAQRTGTSGGEIRHTEIRSDSATQPNDEQDDED